MIVNRLLALKSVLAENDEIDTLIFDEIDTGISGRTAQMVSQKLHMIAGNHQVICITHLPQIAAMADAKVLKTDIKIASDKREEKFTVQATQVVFDGFLKVYMESQDDAQEEAEVLLPELHVGDSMTALGFTTSC